MKTYNLEVLHILDSIALLKEYTSGYNRNTFAATNEKYDAILRRLQTMAEATQKLPTELKESHSSIQWKKISDFRNIVAHDYLGEIITQHLKPLEEATKKMLLRLNEESHAQAT
ncbi:MAG: HepT-like ribonuclease domain-containing protein [Alphaproteobacteria bacterium]